jgi:hypothetical protein
MKIKQMRIVIAILGFIAVLVAAPVASANSFSFTRSGTWDQGTPTTAYSQAGATWNFQCANGGKENDVPQRNRWRW